MSEDIVKIEYRISTDVVGSECSDIVEFPKKYWESLSEKQKIDEIQEVAFQHLDWCFDDVTE